jgi:hypothetical protein
LDSATRAELNELLEVPGSMGYPEFWSISFVNTLVDELRESVYEKLAPSAT